MPLFLCRWPNGDCSVVSAPRKDDAIVKLDQVANAEDCPITQTDVPTILVDRIVGHVAATKLKGFQRRGKPS